MKYYVYTICCGNKTYLNQEKEGTKSECRKYLIGRYGHIPGFAIISTISNFEKAKRKFLY